MGQPEPDQKTKEQSKNSTVQICGVEGVRAESWES